MRQVDLSIVILNYKTKDLTLKCLESIINQYKKNIEENKLEVIVVDNNSEDDSVKALKSAKIKQYFELMESKENLGFGKGNNLGAEKAKGKYLLFMNSDMEIEDNGFTQMVNYMEENDKVGILGGKLYFPDGRIQKSVGKFYDLKSLFLMLFGGERFGLLRESPTRISQVDWVSGACLMIRAELFKKIGCFDKNIFMYFEDVEICYRAKLNGFSTFFFPDIKLLHKERGSSNKTFAIVNIYSGVSYFYKKYMPGWKYRLAIWMLKLKALMVKSIGLVTGNSYYISTYDKALSVLK